MILLDAHQDIAFNALYFNRNYTLPTYKTRRLEANHYPPGKEPGIATLGLPDALIGRVAVVFATIFAAPQSSKLTDLPDSAMYRDPREAYAKGIEQIEYYQRLAGEHEQIRLIKTTADLEAVLATWAPDQPITERVQGMVILMEGADPIIEPKQFEEWYERGVRLVGPAWSATRYSGGTRAPGPLTSMGFELLDVMAGANAILDLSHLSEKAFYQAVERYEGVLLASHSNPRKFCNTDRHLSDEMIRLLAERDGVMGVVTFNRFLADNWNKGDARLPFTVILDVIDHVCQVTGSVQHIGIGSDLDGGFGMESVPQGMDTVGDLWWLHTGLSERGYSTSDIQAILSGNFLRKLRQSLTSI